MELIEPFTSTHVYRFLSIVVDALWSSPIGQIFLVTILLYGFGYLFYTGYLSYFSRGIGSLSLNRLGFHPSDIITLFPTTIFTLFSLIKERTLSVIIYIVGSFIIFGVGIVIGQFIRSYVDITSTLIAVLSISFYLFVLINLPISLILRDISKWSSFAIAWGVQLLIVIIFVMSLPTIQTQQEQPSPLLPFNIPLLEILAVNLLGLMLIALVLLSPMVLGVMTAKFTVKENLLSQIFCLSLKQPLSGLSQFEQIRPANVKKKIPWSEKWFIKSTVNISIEPDVYSYITNTETSLMYLLTSFRNHTAIYVHYPQTNKGNLMLISNEIIYSIEFQSRQS